MKPYLICASTGAGLHDLLPFIVPLLLCQTLWRFRL